MSPESDRWKAWEHQAIEKIVEEHLGEPYWKRYRDLVEALKALLPARVR